jgi:hypothetical protein
VSSGKSFLIACEKCGHQLELRHHPTQPTKLPKRPTEYGAIAPLSGLGAIMDDVLSRVPQSIQTRWMDLYNDPQFIKRETLKAMNWMESRPQNTKRIMGRFLSNWFDKAWSNRAFGEGRQLPQTGLVLKGEVQGEDDDDAPELL